MNVILKISSMIILKIILLMIFFSKKRNYFNTKVLSMYSTCTIDMHQPTYLLCFRLVTLQFLPFGATRDKNAQSAEPIITITGFSTNIFAFYCIESICIGIQYSKIPKVYMRNMGGGGVSCSES